MMALTPEQLEGTFQELRRWGAPAELVERIKRNYLGLHNDMLRYHRWFIELRNERADA